MGAEVVTSAAVPVMITVITMTGDIQVAMVVTLIIKTMALMIMMVTVFCVSLFSVVA